MEHAYFDALVSRPDAWLSYSLRDPAQLQSRQLGGYAQGPAADTLYVIYDLAMDAAKVIVPPFRPATTLAAGIDATSTELAPAGGVTALFILGRQIHIDAEILTVTSRGTTTVGVSRGTFGTTPAAHAAGALLDVSLNSLQNQVWLPMRTEAGHSYLTTWDAWYSRELLPAVGGIDTWKTFQFRNPIVNPKIWFEVRTRFDQAPAPTDVGIVDVRYYGTKGPNITSGDPLSPNSDFTIRPETWLRYWMLLEQRPPGDWDLASVWVADEDRDAVLLIDRAQVDAESVHSFQIEFNTSKDRLEVLRGDLISYVRNVAMLRDPVDVQSLLLRPLAGTPPPPVTLRAPFNVRMSA